MSHEVPEISFKEMLVVTDGPPATVWERALAAAFAAEAQDDGPDGASPAVAAAASGTEPDVDTDADAEDDPDMDGMPAGDFAAAPDPSLGGDEPEPDGWYSEDEVQGDGNDVEY